MRLREACWTLLGLIFRHPKSEGSEYFARIRVERRTLRYSG